MADGTGTLGLRPTERAHLSDALDRGRHLVARCASPSCRRTSPCDPGPWLAEGLGGRFARHGFHKATCRWWASDGAWFHRFSVRPARRGLVALLPLGWAPGTRAGAGRGWRWRPPLPVRPRATARA